MEDMVNNYIAQGGSTSNQMGVYGNKETGTLVDTRFLGIHKHPKGSSEPEPLPRPNYMEDDAPACFNSEKEHENFYLCWDPEYEEKSTGKCRFGHKTKRC